MSDILDTIGDISASIAGLEIARLKGGLWKMTLQTMLAQEGVRGVDWTPAQVFAKVEEAIGAASIRTEMSEHMRGITQDAVAEFRREALDILRT